MLTAWRRFTFDVHGHHRFVTDLPKGMNPFALCIEIPQVTRNVGSALPLTVPSQTGRARGWYRGVGLNNGYAAMPKIVWIAAGLRGRLSPTNRT